jgi:hypothetical protein
MRVSYPHFRPLTHSPPPTGPDSPRPGDQALFHGDQYTFFSGSVVNNPHGLAVHRFAGAYPPSSYHFQHLGQVCGKAKAKAICNEGWQPLWTAVVVCGLACVYRELGGVPVNDRRGNHATRCSMCRRRSRFTTHPMPPAITTAKTCTTSLAQWLTRRSSTMWPEADWTRTPLTSGI